MSSEQKSTNHKRKRYTTEVKLAILEDFKAMTAAEVCRKYGIASSQLYAWKKVYEKAGVDGLIPKSSRPHHQPKKTSDWIVAKILGLKKDRPEMGAKSVSLHLKRHESIDLSSNTVAKVFKKHQLPDGDAGYAENSHFVKGDKDKRLEMAVEKDIDEWERFSRPNPNDLWQMDLSEFALEFKV
jgi:transposase-like protein